MLQFILLVVTIIDVKKHHYKQSLLKQYRELQVKKLLCINSLQAITNQVGLLHAIAYENNTVNQ